MSSLQLVTPPAKKPFLRAQDVVRLRGQREELRRVEDSFRSFDAFQNIASRVGLGTTNLLEATAYPLTRLSRNYILMNSLYRSNWIARKVIDAMPEDMFKNWISFVTEVEPQQLKRLEKKIKDTRTIARLLEAAKLGRLYGGAGAVIVIDGDQDRLDEPLDVDEIMPGTYRGLLAFDRWSGITPSATINSDINRPVDFGLPDSYMVTTETGGTFKIHSSRVLRFIGRELPNWERQAEQYWGTSEIEVFFDELKKRDNTSWNLASLIFRANIFSLKQKDLSQMLSGLGAAPDMQRRWQASLQAMTELMSNQGLVILPEDGTMDTHQYSFSGINDIYQSFMLDICGATEYPMSRLFGRSSSGLSGTGEGDEHAYYDLISAKQKRELDPQLSKLFPVIAMSAWGEIPDDFSWIYQPVRSMSNEEQAENAAKKTTAITEVYNAGIIGRKTALQELRQQADETNLFSNITQKQIDDAEEEPAMGGEMGGEPGMPGGEEGGTPPGGGDSEGEKKDDAGKKEKLPDPSKEIPSTPNSKPKKGQDESIVETFARVGQEHGARKEDFRRRFAGFPDGTTIGGWTKLTVAGDIFWRKGKRVTSYLLEEIGTEVAYKALGIKYGKDAESTSPLRKGSFQGLAVTIENEIGSVRSGKDPITNEPWSVTMTAPYGYIDGTVGVDGDPVDCFIGPEPFAPFAFVIHALRPGTFGEYDEDKVMLGFGTVHEAKQAFMVNYSDPKFFGSLETIPMAQLYPKLRKDRKKIEAVDTGISIKNFEMLAEADDALGRVVNRYHDQAAAAGDEALTASGLRTALDAVVAKFEESKHPRKNDGKFAPKGQGESGASEPTEKPANSKPEAKAKVPRAAQSRAPHEVQNEPESTAGAEPAKENEAPQTLAAKKAEQDRQNSGGDFSIPGTGQKFSLSKEPELRKQQLAKVREESMAALPEPVRAGLMEGKGTNEMFGDGKGNYTPERAAIHQRIIDHYFDGKKPVNNPGFVFVGGGPASGKTTVSDEVVEIMQHNSVDLNIDEIRPMLPEYGAVVGSLNVGQLNEESGDIRDRIIAKAMKGKYNMILDGTGGASAVQAFDLAEENGFNSSYYFVYRPADDATEAAMVRPMRTKNIADLRDMKPEWVHAIHDKARSNFEKMAAPGREVKVVDKSSAEFGKEGRVVFWRLADGTIKIADEDGMKRVGDGGRVKFKIK